MSSGVYAALSGAIAHQTQLETTSTNLANVSSNGYRAVRPVFHEVLAQATDRGERARFSMVRQTAIDTRRGGIKTTERPLDLALGNNSFLAVETPNGERYTRAGSLQISPNGTLTTRTGHSVLSDGRSPIVVEPNSDVSITKEGEVKANGEAVAFLRVVTFNDPRQMRYEGQTLLVPEAEAGAPIASDEELEVGKLEESNSSAVRAMTDLMTASRMFDAMQRAIGTFRSINNRMVRIVPR